MLIIVSGGVVCTLSAIIRTMRLPVLESMSFSGCVLFLFVTLYNGLLIFRPLTGLYHSGLCTEATSRMCVVEGRLIYFKGLAHMIVEAGRSETCRAGQQAGNSGRISIYSLKAEFL